MAMPAATAQQICTFALRKLGVVNRQMPVQVDDMKDALDALWFLLDSFNRQKLLIPFYQTVSFTLTESARVFTIGTGGDFDCSPPIEINSVKVNSGGVIYEVSPFDGIDSFNNISDYADLKQYPRTYLYNKSYPAQQITFDAMLLDGDIVSIYGLFQFDASFTGVGNDVDSTSVRVAPYATQLSLTEETEFPAGYQSMIMWNLTESLLSEYPQNNPVVVQSIMKEAATSRNQIKSQNAKSRNLRFTDTNRPSNWGNQCTPFQWP